MEGIDKTVVRAIVSPYNKNYGNPFQDVNPKCMFSLRCSRILNHLS